MSNDVKMMSCEMTFDHLGVKSRENDESRITNDE